MNFNAILSMSSKARPMLKELEFFERLELCGVWAVLECIEAGCSDESISQMFDAMKQRMIRQVPTLRVSNFIAENIRTEVGEAISRARSP